MSREFPEDPESLPPCPTWGCSLAFLRDFADTGGRSVAEQLKATAETTQDSWLRELLRRETMGFQLGRGFTMSQACKAVILPRSKSFRSNIARRCGSRGSKKGVKQPWSSSLSFAEIAVMLELKDKLGQPAFGKATHFVSHSWNSDFQYFVDALSLFSDSKGLREDEAYFWVDVFVINQSTVENLPQRWWSTRFMQVIQLIGKTVLVVDSWQNIACMQRAWLPWEMYCTIASGARLEIAMRLETLQEFELALVRSYESVQIAVSSMVVSDGQAQGPLNEDQRKINKEIDRTIGFTQLSGLVQVRLHQRLMEVAKKSLEEKRNKENVEGSAARREERQTLQLHVAIFLRERGLIKEPEASLRSLHKELVSEFGEEDKCSINCLNQIAITLHKAGRLDEASAMHLKCFGLCQSTLGRFHEDTLQSQANLAAVLGAQKPLSDQDFKTARALHMSAIAGQEDLHGPNDPRTLCSVSSLAHLLSHAPKLSADILDEAEDYHARACEFLTRTLHRQHPLRLTALLNQALHWLARFSFEGHDPLLDRASALLHRLHGGRSERLVLANPEMVETERLLHETLSNYRPRIPNGPCKAWKAVAMAHCPEVCSACQFRHMRRCLAKFGVDRLHAELVAEHVIEEDFLTTYWQPFNLYARLGSGVASQPKMRSCQTALGAYQDRYLIASNRPELDLMWESEDPAWIGRTSLSKRHVTLTSKELHWEWFNVLTFGLVSGLRRGLMKLQEIKCAAFHWASHIGGWPPMDQVGFFLVTYPHTSVKSLHLHILDMNFLGPSFLKFRHKHLALEAAIEALQAELAELEPRHSSRVAL